jgi:hypothetical protein
MGAPTSEVGYTSATTRRGTTKSIWTCGGIKKHVDSSGVNSYSSKLEAISPYKY